tara:strand:- start:2466 stop:2906 length:441 start_codon:yes stop_codon:yes gene_type:complete
MNKTNRIMKGTYSDYKLIKTRGVISVSVEFPIEQAEEFVRMFGMPKLDTEKWVALAGLNEEVIHRNEDVVRTIQQAGMLCKEINFGRFLKNQKNMLDVIPEKEDTIAKGLRAILGIQSRTDFHNDNNALIAFNRLKSEYETWTINN